MTRINTNVSSLNAQKTLARSNATLQDSLTRLSTGLRINKGKDDPAGLIASETLRSDITATEAAISNSVRANQVIATADSALGQISSLLNDVRGLVVEAANSGAMSADQIAANQLQVDSSLEAINRISQTTSFQGRKLLDGSLSFVTESVDVTKLTDVEVDQANFGTQTSITVGVEIAAQAEKATLTYEGTQLTQDTVLEIGGVDGFEAFSFEAGSTVTEMRDAINLVSDALGITAALADRATDAATAGEAKVVNSGGTDGFTITAATAGASPGNFNVRYALGTTAAVGGNTATWNAGDPNVVDVTVAADQWAAMVSDSQDMGAALGGTDDALVITAKQTGAQFNGIAINLASVTAGAASATYDHDTNVITASITAANDDMSDLVAVLDSDLGELFTFTWAATDDTALSTGTVTFGTATTGVDGGVVSTNGTLTNVADKIDDLTEIAAITVSGGGSLTQITTASGSIGSVNSTDDASASDDPNNLLQLSTTAKGQNTDVTFQAAGASQAFSISYSLNTRTNGYSTANLTSTLDDKDAVLRVVSTTQGQDQDGFTVTFTADATDTSVTWDKQNKALTVFSPATATANDLRDQINAALSGDFTATVVGGGGATASAFATTNSATSTDGKIYDEITVNLATDANSVVTTTAAEALAAINADPAFTALEIGASHGFSSDGSGIMETGAVSLSQIGVTATDATAAGTTAAVNGEKAQITVTALNASSDYDGVQVAFVDNAAVVASSDIFATYDAASKVLTFNVDAGTSTAANVVDNWAANSGSVAAAALFSAAVVNAGTNNVDVDDVAYLSGGTTYSGTSTGSVSADGNYDQGDVVGTGGLEIQSNNYGTGKFVSVKALTGTFTVVDAAGAAKDRDYGADASVRINGIGAVADGLDVSLNTSVLDVGFTIDASFTAGTSTSFSITSGGAQFQLGPDVVSTNQARVAIQSMSTAVLGGKSGRLFQLRSGADYDLDSDATTANKVLDEAISKVVGLRGRLGAFQKTTIDTNIAALSDTLEALTQAESDIRDTDFAKESAALTRAQILVQSSLSVLGIANQNPQSVLSLLR